MIKNADMSEDMQQDAIDCATQVTRAEYFVLNDAASHTCKASPR